MMESDWESVVVLKGRPSTLQHLIDLWSATVWSLVDPDQRQRSERGLSRPELLSCLAIQRDLRAAVSELQSSGKLVGVLGEAEVANINLESFRMTNAKGNANLPNDNAVQVLLPSQTLPGGNKHGDSAISSQGPLDQDWRLQVRLGSRSVSLREVVRGWAAEVWLIFAAQEQGGLNPMNWTLDDFVGALSFRSILHRALQDSENATGRRLTIPSVALADTLLEKITQPDSQGMLRATTLSVVPEEPFGRQWWWERVPANGPILEEFHTAMRRINGND